MSDTGSDTGTVLLAIVGLTLITFITRGLLLFPDRELPLPAWLRRGMRYTPLAALMASVAPQVLVTDGQLPQTWHDPKVLATLAATLTFYWRRDILSTILAGGIVMVGLRAGVGW